MAAFLAGGVAHAAPAASAWPAGPGSLGESASPAAAHDRGLRLPWRFDASSTTLANVNAIVGADRLHALGLDGSGVGVALVDTGTVPVDGLDVVNGADLSIESQAPGLAHLDTFGHGTHLAGIIAGRPANDGSGFGGVAPAATLTSVKVGGTAGIVDVSQVIAGVDWVVAHRNDDPSHPVRVLNLSYSTDGTQDYRLDPLTHAVENAWRAGIVVVVAAGNAGTAPSLATPATDPYVIAVGAADSTGTQRAGDDTVMDFSSRGNASRRVDLVAPGRSIVSLRDPGGYLDESNPQARVGSRYFKGSGTSQAAAVVSGAVALLLQRRPELRPDDVKALLTGTATRLPMTDAAGQGAGELNVARALVQPVPRGTAQRWAPSTGRGSLEASRGTVHISLLGTPLVGEFDLFGPFDTGAWASASSAGTAWQGGTWMGRMLTGSGWDGGSWSGVVWSGLSWSGLSWSGLSWSGLSWSGLSWSGLSWSGLSWSGLSWSYAAWA
jgi:serine protease AprX